MLQKLSETDLLRMEFADFCHARGDVEYDYTSYHSCAALQFVRARPGRVSDCELASLYAVARIRPWNFRALAKRLALAEGQRT